MMGLCLLPIARSSRWLDAAAAGFPEAIPFHRVTGWWCVAQVVIHSVCYPLRAALDALSDYRYHHRNHTRHHHPHCAAWPKVAVREAGAWCEAQGEGEAAQPPLHLTFGRQDLASWSTR